MKGDLAPIALFVFRRPLETLQCLFALQRCPELARSHLHIFCDGPRNLTEKAQTDLVQEVVNLRPWAGELTVHRQDRNMGLAFSIQSGVSALCRDYGKVIVLEDDLVVASGFLSYMNNGLATFAAQPNVFQVSGHTFPAWKAQDGAVFLPTTTTWGWGTWTRAWSQYQEVPTDIYLLDQDLGLRQRFNLGGAYDYASILKATVDGNISSWGVRWWWSVFRAGGMTLFPLRSLVANIGLGSGATNTQIDDLASAAMWQPDAAVAALPAKAEIDHERFRAWCDYMRGPASPRVGAVGQLTRAARAIRRAAR